MLPPTTRWGFAVAILAVLAIAGLSYRSLASRSSTAAEMTRTRETTEQLELLLSTLKDAETGQRGYLLSGDARYLEPYTRAVPLLSNQLQNLRASMQASPSAQQRRFGVLERLVADKLAELRETVELRRAGQVQSALDLVRSDRGNDLMDHIRETLKELTDEERRLLATQLRDWQEAASLSTYVTVGGSSLLLVLIFGAAYVTSREFRGRSVQAWLMAGQQGLAARVLGEQRSDELARHILDYLAGLLDARVGALYALERDGTLKRAASYATAAGTAEAREGFRLGEGLVGQAAAGNELLHLADVPAGYLQVSSGVGARSPLHLVLAPSRADGAVNGVIELGFFRPVLPYERELLSLLAEQIGIALRTAQYRTRLERLLEETQRQSEELQTQQEELRVSNEELGEQSRALRESQARLEGQQTELEQINAQLEEQAQILENQKQALVGAQGALLQKNTELERANQYKSEFLANMSHELRTPLNSSLILSKLLAENKAGNLTAEQVKFAETIYSAGNDLLTLINDVLDLSKIEAGMVEVRSEPIALTHLGESVTRTFQPLANERKLKLTVHVEAGAPPVIETDRQRLEQILKNLLSNAFKFTEHGEVSLRMFALDGGRVGLAVRDTGIGISEQHQELIFEAFRQIDSTSNRKYAGTGLGLSISRDLARLLGGELRVESAMGQGSTFTLVIPTRYEGASPAPQREAPAAARRVEPARPRLPEPAPSASPAPRAPAATGQPSAGSPAARAPAKADRRILVIEDDTTFANILAELVRELEFECVVAHSGEEGVQLALTLAPRAIVLDVGLPDHSGLSILERLKRDPATRHIPVHMVSASDHTQTALELGAVGYALKPVDREELAQALQKLASKAAQGLRRILIVEDDPVQRDSVAKLLGSESVDIVPVETANEALARLRESTFDCMVMDLNLPDASGYELLERMAKEEMYSFPPVIVYTGRSLDRHEEERLRRYSRSIIIKGAKSPERLIDEVTLFLHQVEAQLPPERQRVLREARDREALFEGRCILVVEDDIRNIFALSRVLEPKGARVDIARNGREALARLERGPAVDLVLMDVMMPEMDGLQATREIRKRREWEKLPIIVLTAKAMSDDQEKCLEAGANDYVAKPIDVDKLLSLLRVWMPK